MNKNFKQFEQIVETMKKNKYDYKKDIHLEKIERRKNRNEFSFKEHLETLIFALLSNQRPWKQIADNYLNIKNIFNNFDKEYIKSVDPNFLVKQLLLIKCGNRQIKKQMESLKTNILVFEKIEKEFGSIDNFINSDSSINIANKFANSGNYKLKQMGLPLVSEYLKGVGVDIIKPDVHVCRILSRLGFSINDPATINEAYEICDAIAKENNLTNTEVDSILWQYCANNFFECCTNKPNCKICLVEDCKYKKSL